MLERDDRVAGVVAYREGRGRVIFARAAIIG